MNTGFAVSGVEYLMIGKISLEENISNISSIHPKKVIPKFSEILSWEFTRLTVYDIRVPRYQ